MFKFDQYILEAADHSSAEKNARQSYIELEKEIHSKLLAMKRLMKTPGFRAYEEKADQEYGENDYGCFESYIEGLQDTYIKYSRED